MYYSQEKEFFFDLFQKDSSQNRIPVGLLNTPLESGPLTVNLTGMKKKHNVLNIKYSARNDLLFTLSLTFIP